MERGQNEASQHTKYRPAHGCEESKCAAPETWHMRYLVLNLVRGLPSFGKFTELAWQEETKGNRLACWAFFKRMVRNRRHLFGDPDETRKEQPPLGAIADQVLDGELDHVAMDSSSELECVDDMRSRAHGARKEKPPGLKTLWEQMRAEDARRVRSFSECASCFGKDNCGPEKNETRFREAGTRGKESSVLAPRAGPGFSEPAAAERVAIPLAAAEAEARKTQDPWRYLVELGETKPATRKVRCESYVASFEYTRDRATVSFAETTMLPLLLPNGDSPAQMPTGAADQQVGYVEALHALRLMRGAHFLGHETISAGCAFCIVLYLRQLDLRGVRRALGIEDPGYTTEELGENNVYSEAMVPNASLEGPAGIFADLPEEMYERIAHESLYAGTKWLRRALMFASKPIAELYARGTRCCSAS